MEWLEKLYSAHWSNRFQSRAAQLYGHLEDVQTLAEDAASMTAVKLCEHSEAEATDPLIITVFSNALTDCVRERQGFPRPRKWLHDMGDIGKRLFKLICLKGSSRSDLLQWVEAQTAETGQIPGDAPTVAAAQALAQSIFDQMQEAQECAPWRRQMAREGSDEDETYSPFATLSGAGPLPEEELAFDQLRHFIEALVSVGGSETAEGDRRRMHALADKTWQELGLDDHDRLVMNAYLGRGLWSTESGQAECTEKDIAADLGLSVPQVRNRRKKVLAAMLAVFS